MPGPRLTAELMLNLHTQDVVKDLEKSLTTGTQRAMRDAKKMVSDAFREATAQALTSGKVGDAMRDLHKAGVVEAQQGYLKLQRQIEALEKKALDDKLTTEEKAQMRLLRDHARGQKELLDDRMKAFKREQDLQRRAAKEQRAGAKDMAEGLENAAESLRGVFAGGFGGMARGARGLGERAHGAGEGRIERARQMGMQPGADPQQVAQMAKMGRALAKVGAALATVAAVVGAVVVLIKLFADLESRAKDMNKALMETAGAADFGFSAAEVRAGALRRTLEELRDETTGVNENFRKFRAGAKEQQRILATLNQAGMTYARMNEEIKQGSKFMESYSDATALAVVYSRNLGVESTEIAQTMGEFAFETGMRLDQVAESFSIIQREAMNAGFQTKRFYSAIVEATSGMNFYGVRIEETTKLLKSFDSLLGEAAGTEVFKRIAQEGGKSFQNTLREFLIKEPEFVAQQYETVFEQRLATLERQLQDTLPEGVTVRGLIEETGGGAALAQRLEEMGITGQQGTDIMQAAELMRAASGDLAAMVGARGAAGPAFEAVMKLRQMPGLGAGKSLGEVYENAVKEGNTGLLVALQNLAEAQGKDFDELKVLDQKNLGRLRALQKVAQEGGEVPEHLQELGYFIQRLPDGTAKVMKGVVDQAGVVNKESAVEITDRFDMLLTEPTEDAKRLEKQMTVDQQIASEISRNITGMNDIMEQSVAAILNDIYDVLISIADFLFKDDPERHAEVRFQEKMAEESKKATEKLGNLTDEQNKLVAKQERGEELTKAEQARLENLPDDIARAMDEAEFARDTAEMAKRAKGEDILEKGVPEMRRLLRVQAGDVEAATEEAAAATKEAREKAGRVAAVGPEAQMPWYLRKAQDVASMLTPGSGAQALTERATAGMGLTGFQAKTRAKIGRALGMEDYEGLSDADIEALGDAVQRGTERVYEDRSVFADLFGVGTVSARASRQEGARLEVGDAFYEMSQTEREQAEKMREAMEEGFEGLKGAVETSGMLNLFGSAKKANDLVIPAGGGKPIITDEKDTLMAYQPGGPMAAGAGRGGGNVEINVYGGDQKKVYDTVMKALKATGNA